MSTRSKKPAGASPVPGTQAVGSVAACGSSTDETSTIETDTLGRVNDLKKFRLPAKATEPKKRHPMPVNKAAKEHYARALKVGIRNFSEFPFPYWEPSHPGEPTSEKNARRQIECAEASDYLTQLEREQEEKKNERRRRA